MKTRKRMQRFLSIFLACIMILNVPMSALAFEDVMIVDAEDAVETTVEQQETDSDMFDIETVETINPFEGEQSPETDVSQTGSDAGTDAEEQTGEPEYGAQGNEESETVQTEEVKDAAETPLTETEFISETPLTELLETELSETETEEILNQLDVNSICVSDNYAGTSELVKTDLSILDRTSMSDTAVIPENISIYHAVVMKEADRISVTANVQENLQITDFSYAESLSLGEYELAAMEQYVVSDGSEAGQAMLVQYFGEVVFEYLASPVSVVYYAELVQAGETGITGTGIGLLIEQVDTEGMVQTLADDSGATTEAGKPNITSFSVMYGSNAFTTDVNVVYTLPQSFVTRFNLAIPPKKQIVEGTGEVGTLSYEWYSNTENSYEGATLLDFDKDGRNDLNGDKKNWYTKPTTVLGTTYYFCKVINTLKNGDSNYAYTPIGSVTIQEPETKAIGIITNEEPIGKIYVKAEDTVAKQTDQKDKYGNPIEDPGPIGVIFDYTENGTKQDAQEGTGMYLYPSDTMTTVIARAALLSGTEIGINGTPGSGMGSYIYMLGGREEFDRGADSGWMGSLNGWYTNTGFDNYSVANGELKSGDIIYLKYTTNLGKDIGCEFGNGSDSQKLRSLSLVPLKSNNYTVSGLDFLNGEFDPDIYEYEMPYTPASNWKGVLVVPEAENANNRVRVYADEQEYRGLYKIPITTETSKITIMIEDPNAEEGTAATTYTIYIKRDQQLLQDGSITLTELAADGHDPQPTLKYQGKGSNSSIGNTFTATLQADTSVEAYRTKDLKVTLNDLPEGVSAAVKYKGQSWQAENGTVTIPEGTLFTGTRTYSIILTRQDGTKEIYYLELSKSDVRIESYSFQPMLGESKADCIETINGQLEGTWFQLDENGSETGKTGFTSDVTDYNIYFGSFVDTIAFEQEGITGGNGYAFSVTANEVTVENANYTQWGTFWANVLKKSELKTIQLKEGVNEVSLTLCKPNDVNITRTYTLHISKKSATAAELQERILALPALEDLSYSRDRGTVNTLQAIYDQLTEEQKQEVSKEAKEKLEASVKQIKELYDSGMADIASLKDQIAQFSGKVTEENYKEYEEAVTKAQNCYYAMTDWIYDTFMEDRSAYNALINAIETIKKAKIINNETTGVPTDYIDDFMVSANAFNLSIETYKNNAKAYQVSFKDYIPSNPQGGPGTEACLPHNTPGRIKWTIEDESIFRIDSEISTYIDQGLGGGNKGYDNELYYMVPLKEGTTTFTVTLTDQAGNYYGQTPKMIVHVNSEGEAAIEKLENKLTNINSLPYTTKYDTWYYWQGTEGAEFSFHVNGTDAKVEVWDYEGSDKTAYPVDKNGDVTVLLKDGYNSIEVTATYEGQRVTQVYGLRAKVISYTLTNESRPGKALKVGDQATLIITGLTTPVYKILRIYNPSGVVFCFDTDMPYQSQLTSGGTQYSIGSMTFTVTSAGTSTLTNGCIYQRWWGSPLYSETAQGNTGGIAAQPEGYFSHIPDITFTAEENPDYKADIKIHTTVKGDTTVKPGAEVTLNLDDLNLNEITSQYPVNTTNTFKKLQTLQTLFMTSIPGLSQITSETYDRNKQNSLDVIKTVTFTVPEDTPDGTYTIKGGYVHVMAGDPSYGISPAYMFKMQIDDVQITVQHEHSYGSWSVTKAATCTLPGVKSCSCTKCGDIKTEGIPANGHTKGAWTETKAATCKDTGIKVQKCSVCGEVLKTENIPVTNNHKYASWKKVSDATVFAAEVQKHTCSVCGASETKNAGSKLTAVLELPGKLTSISIKKGNTKFLNVTMANGDSVVSVKSSAPKTLKATLDKNGKITLKALKKGSVKLTIKLASKTEKTYTVKVVTGTVKTTKLTVTSVTNNKLTLKKGKTHTLKSELKPFTSTQKVTYKTSNKKVATVTSSGKIKAVGAGKATITVTSGSKKVKVTVTVPGITGLKSSVTVKRNKTTTLKPKAYGISEKVTYTSSNQKVATVTAAGKVKGIKKGSAKITVQAGSYKYTVTVKVK